MINKMLIYFWFWLYLSSGRVLYVHGTLTIEWAIN